MGAQGGVFEVVSSTNESAFKKRVRKIFEGGGIESRCIESGATSDGLPDLYCTVFDGDWPGVSFWVELKCDKDAKFTESLKRVYWRKGQPLFFKKLAEGGCSMGWTLVEGAEAVMAIPMLALFKLDFVPKEYMIELDRETLAIKEGTDVGKLLRPSEMMRREMLLLPYHDKLTGQTERFVREAVMEDGRFTRFAPAAEARIKMEYFRRMKEHEEGTDLY